MSSTVVCGYVERHQFTGRERASGWSSFSKPASLFRTGLPQVITLHTHSRNSRSEKWQIQRKTKSGSVWLSSGGFWQGWSWHQEGSRISHLALAHRPCLELLVPGFMFVYVNSPETGVMCRCHWRLWHWCFLAVLHAQLIRDLLLCGKEVMM